MPYWVPPWPRRHLDPVKTADVVVYRDGEYAVAVDRHGRPVAGPSDDHAEVIRNAIDYLPASGGRIFIAPGVYNLASSVFVVNNPGYGDIYAAIRIDKPVELIGSGMGKTILLLGSHVAANVIAVYNTSYVKIEGMTIDGNKVENEDAGIDGNQIGIWSGGERYYEVYENLEIKNCVREGLYIGYFNGASRGANIKNVIAHDNGLSGIVFDRPLYLDAYRLYAFNNGRYGVYVSAASLLSFVGNISSVFAFNNNDVGVHIKNVEGLILSGVRSISNGVTNANTSAHGVLISNSKNIIAGSIYVKDNYGVGFYIYNSIHVKADVTAEANNNIGVRLYDAKYCIVSATTNSNTGAALAEQNLSDYNILIVAWESDGAAPSTVGANTILTAIGS